MGNDQREVREEALQSGAARGDETGGSAPVRGRLAPSPTGALHLGNARTFLIAWLRVRSRAGALILRMEDLDHPKIKRGAARETLDDLRWLGFDWDEGPDCGGPFAPYTQSERRAYYARVLQRLIARGQVYPCICSRRDVEAGQSAPHAEDGLFYPGTCRGRFADYPDACRVLPTGRLPAWRFRVAAGERVAFDDKFHGRVEQDVAAASGDFVLARDPDGAGYMLAVVADDAAMGITEVVRGDDLLPATPRQILLYRELGFPPPLFVHVPLVVSEEGRRLAKRHGDTRIRAFREAGVPPEKIIGLLAWWCGWAEWGEMLSLNEVLPRFDMRRLPREPVVLTSAIRRELGIR
ncbi:MAG TPA: tRNA glutamyl-Q(34) synthetase GluQRS [Kiritimatiellia bacterium]|nr:tRNA glutamyl-Q(34) synthetase GluQRS [Kiritimatiellia bacterium]HPC49273.1 tRNA glutamyl-Q(34) synthetase GluQRS [Kiritimatiellia bacterium]HPW75539.1 tRNA glutamyl-Q(34) synthetase GluQRS [Kiritimatiellia bacterium]HRU19110.1 tRNA glutamyl-Q(34) synthetase GluQRS [Kiritimatiellia bacterium]